MRLPLNSPQKDLLQSLHDYDGRDTKYLQSLADRFSGPDAYCNDLIAAAAKPNNNVSDGATWLILAHLRGNHELNVDQVLKLISSLDQVTSWGAKLHVCQSARLLPMDVEGALKLAEWLRPLLVAEKPFLRAWSLDAFLHVGTMLPSHVGEGIQALKAGFNDPAASVRARARSLQKSVDV